MRIELIGGPNVRKYQAQPDTKVMLARVALTVLVERGEHSVHTPDWLGRFTVLVSEASDCHLLTSLLQRGEPTYEATHAVALDADGSERLCLQPAEQGAAIRLIDPSLQTALRLLCRAAFYDKYNGRPGEPLQ